MGLEEKLPASAEQLAWMAYSPTAVGSLSALLTPGTWARSGLAPPQGLVEELLAQGALPGRRLLRADLDCSRFLAACVELILPGRSPGTQCPCQQAQPR